MEFITGIPSSDIPTHPASYISPMLANASPFSSFVIAPTGKTFIIPSVLAFNIINSVTDALSFMGLVFGMHTIDVKPPAAADRQPVLIVSLYS